MKFTLSDKFVHIVLVLACLIVTGYSALMTTTSPHLVVTIVCGLWTIVALYITVFVLRTTVRRWKKGEWEE